MSEKAFALVVLAGVGLVVILLSKSVGGLITAWQQARWAKRYGPQAITPQLPEPSWRLQRGVWVWSYRLAGLAFIALAAYLYFEPA